jgi:tetratricopeptide (TPR) repeat protein
MKTLLTLLFLAISWHVFGQVTAIDSLRSRIKSTSNAEQKIDLINQLAFLYTKISTEKSKEAAMDALNQSIALQFQKGIADSYNNLGVSYAIGGSYDKGLEFFLKALHIREELKDTEGSAKVINNISGIFLYQNDLQRALEYSNRALSLLRSKGDNKSAIANSLVAIGQIYENMKDTTRALNYFQQALSEFKLSRDRKKQGETLLSISNLYEKSGQHRRALDYCFQAMDLIDIRSDYLLSADLFVTIAKLYSNINNDPTALHYFHLSLAAADSCKSLNAQMNANQQLSEFFQKKKQYDSALFYYQRLVTLHKETFSHEMASQLALVEKVYESETKDQQLALHKEEISAQRWIIATIGVFLLFTTITAFLLFRIYRQKQKVNQQLSELNKQVSERNEEISLINENLEREVQRRTEKIRAQNEKLIEFAFLNAHKVRGPLARILGLSMLIKREMTLEEIRELNEKVQANALELDTVIREVGKRIEAEENLG